jgi:hypothetical protein
MAGHLLLARRIATPSFGAPRVKARAAIPDQGAQRRNACEVRFSLPTKDDRLIDVLVQGKLVKDPERRTARNGNDYAIAQVSVAMGEESILAQVIAFRDSAVAALTALERGDAVAIAGSAQIGTWTNRDGETRASLSITAEIVTTAYHVRRKRQAVQDERQALAA